MEKCLTVQGMKAHDQGVGVPAASAGGDGNRLAPVQGLARILDDLSHKVIYITSCADMLHFHEASSFGCCCLCIVV